MTTETPPPTPVTPVTPVTPPRPLARAARPLGWRNPWTRLLGALAAFQAGVIVTLLWTSGGGNEGARSDAPVKAVSPSPMPSGNPNPSASPRPNPSASPNPSPNPSLNPSPSPSPDRLDEASSSPTPIAPASPERPTRPRAPTTGRKPVAPTAPVDEPPAPPPAPEAAMVEVEIVSEPEGATVRIGGAVWGVTPLTALLPTASPASVHLELAGHRPARLSWSPSSGRRTLRATLAPLESP